MFVPVVRPRIVAGLAAVILLQSASASAESVRPHSRTKNGTLLASEPITPPPFARAAYKILYRSTDSKGRAVDVSGLAALPRGRAPARGRPIVSWGHGTTGVAHDCAPSRHPEQAFSAVPALSTLLAKGHIVVATDYLGLGTSSVHPYLDGDSAARSMIDAVRAVRKLPDNGSGARFAAFGFSQGGQASLFVGARSSSYAPELELVGISVASAPTELRPLFKADARSRVGEIVSAYAVASWARFYRAPIDAIVEPDSRAALRRIARTCSMSVDDDIILGLDSFEVGRSGLLKPGADTQSNWSNLIDRNSAPLPQRDVPVFMAQGGSDELVEPSVTRDYVRRLCSSGRRLRYMELTGLGHGWTAKLSARRSVSWIASRFTKLIAPDDCLRSAMDPGLSHHRRDRAVRGR